MAAPSTFRPSVVPSSDPYVQRYGARVGNGAEARWLGNPGAFTFSLVDRCNYWLPSANNYGDGYLILIASPAKQLYDWNGVAMRQTTAYQGALTEFAAVESATILAAGGSIGRSYVSDGRYLMISDLLPTGTAPYAGAAGSALRMQVLPPNWDQGQPLAFPVRDAVPTTDWTCNRLHDGFTVGGAQFEAVVNPTLRIGYITGFPGMICGGDCDALSTVEGIAAIVEAVAGAVTGNIGLEIGAVNLGMAAWNNYAGQIESYGQARDAKFILEAAAYQVGSNCGNTAGAAAPDWIQRIKDWI